MNLLDTTPVPYWTKQGFLAQHKDLIHNNLLVRVLRFSPLPNESRAQLVQNLLDLNCNSNTRDKYYNNTVLHLACIHRHKECVPVLLQYGANPNICNDYGWTPLMYSLQQQDTDTAKFLLEHGTDVHIKNSGGNTAAQYASNVEEENDVVKSLFETYGANPFVQGCLDLTLFHCCILDETRWLLTWLLQQYPEAVNLKFHNLTLLQYGQMECTNTLIQQDLVMYTGNRVAMQLWAAITLQKSRMLHQYFVQHCLCDYHLWEEWVNWFAYPNTP